MVKMFAQDSACGIFYTDTCNVCQRDVKPKAHGACRNQDIVNVNNVPKGKAGHRAPV